MNSLAEPFSPKPPSQRLLPRFLLFVVVPLLLAGCWEDILVTPATPPPDTGDLQVYFTDPGGLNSSTLRGGPDAHLADAIDGARLSVDVAALDLNLWSIRDALLEAHKRGVSVRMVTESEYLDTPEIMQIKEAGIPVLGDRREGLMHNKFVVIDHLQVWTGSMNLTVNGAYRNDNNLVWVQSANLAEDYTVEFEEMFVEDAFGPGSPANTPYPSLRVGDALLEVYFSPEDGTARRLVELIGGARESIYFLAYSFTADDIADALMERHRAGIRVAGVLDAGQASSNLGGEYERLRQTGVDVRLDGNRNRMHHKLLIIDSMIVVSGSYNFSASAEQRNDENTLVIHSQEFAALYLTEFERVYSLAQD